MADPTRDPDGTDASASHDRVEADRPVVRETDPPLPDVAFAVVNPLVGLLLRSPLHGLVSDSLLLLTFTGRRSGREYTTPVGYHRVDGEIVLFNDSGWWRNLVDGSEVTVMLRGERRRATAEAHPDAETTAEYVRALLAASGPGYARRLGLDLRVERVPTVEELASGIEETVAITLALDAEADDASG